MQCGRVLEDTAFSADITFQKDAGGESTVVGQFVNEAGVARGIGRIHGGRVYSYQVGGVRWHEWHGTCMGYAVWA